MAIFSICDLTHWEAWGDLQFIWKRKYSLPTRGNVVGLCNSTSATGRVVFNGVKQEGEDVSWTLWFCFCGATHEWMSYVFEVLLLFRILVPSLLSRWDRMNVCVKLLAYDLWVAKEDTAGFLSVGVDILINYIWNNDQFPFPMWQRLI